MDAADDEAALADEAEILASIYGAGAVARRGRTVRVPLAPRAGAPPRVRSLYN